MDIYHKDELITTINAEDFNDYGYMVLKEIDIADVYNIVAGDYVSVKHDTAGAANFKNLLQNCSPIIKTKYMIQSFSDI